MPKEIKSIIRMITIILTIASIGVLIISAWLSISRINMDISLYINWVFYLLSISVIGALFSYEKE